VPPVDVGTTGNTPSYEPQPTTTAPTSFSQNPIVQIEGGVLEGLFLGILPFGAVAEQVLTGTGALPRGTVAFERGLALGQMAAGLAEMAAGAGVGAFGGLLSTTGIGATLGVPAIVVSAVVVTAGAANVAAGLAGLMSSGSGSAATREGGKFGSGKPSHTAEVTVERDGNVVSQETVKSGGMTPDEAKLGFPKSSLATHTEARAVRSSSLSPGDKMIIKGQYPPCPSCKGRMSSAARESGATIEYHWDGKVWIVAGGSK